MTSPIFTCPRCGATSDFLEAYRQGYCEQCNDRTAPPQPEVEKVEVMYRPVTGRRSTAHVEHEIGSYLANGTDRQRPGDRFTLEWTGIEWVELDEWD